MRAAFVSRRSMNSLRRPAAFVLVAICLLMTANRAAAEGKTAPATNPDLQALFLSDIHFEPFFDPAKVQQLAAAPSSEWKGILTGAPSADREQKFAAVQQACHARGEDTSFPLLESSLSAIRTNAAEAKFVTVSGDLISHAFTCKFETSFPKAAPGDYRAFVEKTLSFLMGEVGASLPGVPIYWALGNNDSDCGDYKLDAHSEFLATVGEEVARGFPSGERKNAAEEFAAGGYYSVRLPAPVHDARMIVLDDQFMGGKYETCGGKEDGSAADAQIAWLTQQLAEARSKKEKVWFMAHIPPGVDVHSSVTHMDQVCGARGPRMFLGSEKLADVLAEYSDVVKLAIFAHTHMDEVRVLGSGAKGVAVKMVSSISPINGNAPSFTLARVDAATAELKDFKVFSASNATGVDTTWQQEYDWGKTYGQSAFTAATVSKVVAGFVADPEAKTEASQAYIKDFYVGASPLLSLVWQQYVCGLQNDSAQAYKACVCRAAK